MIVAGVMSGTSADGINVALVRVGRAGSGTIPAIAAAACCLRASAPRIDLLGHAEYAYPKRVRAFILASMNSTSASVADLARLNSLLGSLYADAVLSTQRRLKNKSDLIGCHGQTLYHQAQPAGFLGHKIATTWQTGEPAIIAARVGAPVVSDFRPADMAAGGKGAPLVPFLDYMLFRDRRIGRIVQNIGGIANLTAIPAGASESDLIAFDTGPGNMVIDAVTEKLYARTYDRGGKLAASGTVLEHVLKQVLRRSYFRKEPPKTAGREEFGRQFVDEFLRLCMGSRKQDVVATATALTARSIAQAIRRLSVRTTSGSNSAYREMVLSGGGSRNLTLLQMLRQELLPLGLTVRVSDEFGLPSPAKEAVAFALLAYQTWHQRAASLPAATGATRPVILGRISYP